MGLNGQGLRPLRGWPEAIGLDHRALPCVGGYAPVGAWFMVFHKNYWNSSNASSLFRFHTSTIRCS